MRQNKTVLLIFSLMFLVSLITPLSGEVVKYKTYEEYKLLKLKSIAKQNGSVRIILKLDVPNVENLTARSTAYRTGSVNEDRMVRQSALNADLELKSAIHTTRDAVLHQLNDHPYQVVSTLRSVPYMSLLVPARTLEKLTRIPEVLDIMEVRRIRLPKSQPLEEDRKSLKLSESIQIIGAQSAWSSGATGSGWYSAVIDSGLRNSHNMFAGKPLHEACFVTSLNGEGLCPNGSTSMTGPGAAAHDYNHMVPGYDHGTHVAGIAVGNDGSEHFGVAKDAGLIAIQTFQYFSDDNDISALNYDILAALDYVYSIRNDFKIAAVNMSLGGGLFSAPCGGDLYSMAISNLKSVGIATIVSSGNEYQCGRVGSPACSPDAVAVNASTKGDKETSFGNKHDEMVALMAPGDSILSSMANFDSHWGVMSGTSQAAPHVTGAWTVIKQFNENLSNDEILALLKESGTPISSVLCPGFLDKPRLDLAEAIALLSKVAPPRNVSAAQQSNKSLLQKEYLNVVTWEANPMNDDQNLTLHKIYMVQNNELVFLGQVNANTFTYQHRKVQKNANVTYAVTVVNSDGEESSPTYFALTFVVTQ